MAKRIVNLLRMIQIRHHRNGCLTGLGMGHMNHLLNHATTIIQLRQLIHRSIHVQQVILLHQHLTGSGLRQHQLLVVECGTKLQRQHMEEAHVQPVNIH